MEETVSLRDLKAFVEKKTKKKTILKVIWNDQEKITLLITPNMKINSFIIDEKEGYLFYDIEGKLVQQAIPCVLPEDAMLGDKISLDKSVTIGGQALSKDDKALLKG
ncbi:hypothetical protein [Oceanobacillus manasiensis]|uniref:hypothetical protein n=1 Tax=Oceanobacillus manasiensis TaxID=586413 RepID=UPI0005A648B5|nr:hypothetical protein [Oceanobacillus manasiensis]